MAEHLRENIMEEDAGKFFEEASLKAIYKSLLTRNLNFIEVMLLISELPNILPLKYPAVKDIINACIQLLPQVKKFIHSTITTDKTMLQWKNFTKYDYILRILQNVKI